MSVHNKIKELRKKKGWAQTELAKKIKIKNSNLSCYETGKIVPSIAVLERFAKVFGVSVDYFLSDTFNIDDAKFVKVEDVNYYNKFKQLENLPDDDTETLTKAIDSFIVKNKNLSQAI